MNWLNQLNQPVLLVRQFLGSNRTGDLVDSLIFQSNQLVQSNSMNHAKTWELRVDFNKIKYKLKIFMISAIRNKSFGLLFWTKINNNNKCVVLVDQESTLEAEVIRAGERRREGGLHVYELEYKVDSSRGGLKTVFSAAFVASNKLYLLNITHSDKPDRPLDSLTRMSLERVLRSFDTAWYLSFKFQLSHSKIKYFILVLERLYLFVSI